MNRRLAKRVVSYAQGAGSVLDIAPTKKTVRIVSKKSPNARIHADFQLVGKALYHGMDTVKREISPRGPKKAVEGHPLSNRRRHRRCRHRSRTTSLLP